jgi:hypothetical protein
VELKCNEIAFATGSKDRQFMLYYEV